MSTLAPAKPSAVLDLDRSAVARYLQLSSLFRRRIEYGEWPVGQQIPTLEQLTLECGVAPATIRKALDSLAAEGLLVRYRARGTYVLRSPVRSIWREIETDSGGFLRAREGANIKMISSTLVKTPPFKPEGEVTFAKSYRRLRRVYWRDDGPFLLNDHYIDARLAKLIPRAHFTSKAAKEMTDDLPGVRASTARQTLTITSADIEAAHYLATSLNAPLARIDRTRIDPAGRLLIFSTGLYRGDVVRLDFVEEGGS